MPPPLDATYSLDVRIAANGAFRIAIDGNGLSPGIVRIRTAADALLATLTLPNPCGTVSNTTGVLTFNVPSAQNASATGTAAYAEFCNAAGEVKLALPAQQGTVAVSGRFVMNSLSLVSGSPVQILAASVG